MGTWTNGDGLFIKYGQTEVTPATGGFISTMGFEQIVEFSLDLTLVTAVSAPYIVLDNVVIPDNSRILWVETVVTEVSAGANANLDLGLVKLDRTTEIDFNGLLAASDSWHTGALGLTERLSEGGTEHGALLGTVTTDPGLICANYDTAAFTDGTLLIRVAYRPNANR